MKLEYTSEEQRKAYLETANEWLRQSTMFSDTKSVARGAVAEYLANQDGLTLFTSDVGREYNATN